MQAGLHIDVRPARPPTLDAPITAHETFYAAVSSGAPPDLPLPTLNKFKQAQAAYTALEANNARIARPGDDVVVVPLGTSSALPNKYRNGEFPSHRAIFYAHTDPSSLAFSWSQSRPR